VEDLGERVGFCRKRNIVRGKKMVTRAQFLSFGATGGLLLLAWFDSFLLALLLGSVIFWAWLMDWCQGSFCTSPARLDGKIALVTGANTGIGLETAKALAARGAKVLLGCRDLAKGEAAKQEILRETGAQGLEVVQMDLTSFASVRSAAETICAKLAKLDILVNNAGVAFHPRTITIDGQEQTLQVNHLSHFLLTQLLLDLLKASGSARVINVSSITAGWWAKKGIDWDDLTWQKVPFDSWAAYGQSKLANIWFTRELARREANHGITAYAVHPGSVNSELTRVYLGKVPAFLRGYVCQAMAKFQKTGEAGAQTSVHCAVTEGIEKESGSYYEECKTALPPKLATDDKQAKKLWEVSKKIVGDISPLKPSGAPLVETIGQITTKDIKSSEGGQSPTKTGSHFCGTDLLMQELTVKDVEQFDKSELKKTETQESFSGAELLKKELEVKSLNKEVQNFDRSGLNETTVEEKYLLPNQRDIKLERDKIELIGGIENFDVDNLSRVTVKEPLSGAELLQQELSHKKIQEEIGSFDQEALRSTEVKDGTWLPDTKDLQEERGKVEHLAGIETFDTEALKPVKVQEPLSGAELLKRELTVKAVAEEVTNFDVGSMKPTSVEEKNVLPDQTVLMEEKSRESLLTGVTTFSHSSLSHVTPVEPLSGAELVQRELNIQNLVTSVTTFDSGSLKTATTEEKTLLPDAETIALERERINLLKSLEGEHNLSPVAVKEPLTGAELLKQELTRAKVMESLETFDVEGLKHSQVQEKTVLPDVSTIQEEKTHVEHLKGIGGFDQSLLTKVKTPEPLSGAEVWKQESLRDTMNSEVATFDKTELKETEVEEKFVLPGPMDIQAEKQHQDLLQGLEEGLQLKKTETREPLDPLELAKLELHKDQIEEELQAFDRARLTPVVTEEKLFLPSAEELRAEVVGQEMDDALEGGRGHSPDGGPAEGAQGGGGAKGLKDLLGEELEEQREQRSSSEEWEKVEGADSEC